MQILRIIRNFLDNQDKRKISVDTSVFKSYKFLVIRTTNDSVPMLPVLFYSIIYQLLYFVLSQHILFCSIQFSFNSILLHHFLFDSFCSILNLQTIHAVSPSRSYLFLLKSKIQSKCPSNPQKNFQHLIYSFCRQKVKFYVSLIKSLPYQ